MEERRRLLTGLGGEVGWALRPKQPLEDGTNLYQKPTPKQDKGGGIDPPPRALACGLEDDAAGRHLPPRRLSFSVPPLALNTRETRGWFFAVKTKNEKLLRLHLLYDTMCLSFERDKRALGLLACRQKRFICGPGRKENVNDSRRNCGR